MKNTIKYFLLILLGFISIDSNGQILIKSGLSYSSFTNINWNGRTNTPDFKNGFHISISKEEGITDNLFLEAGPRLQIKGSNFNSPYTITITLTYLELPMLAKFYFDLNDDIFFYGAAGAYLGVGISGTGEEQRDFDMFLFNIEWRETKYGFKRLDYGLSFGFGFLFKHVVLGVDFDRGLNNINADATSSKDKTMNNVFRVSVGCRFPKLTIGNKD